MKRKIISLARAFTAGAALACAFAAPVAAQAQPKLQLVVPYGPGNGLDLLAREFAEALRVNGAGSTVVVENREGARGVVGTSHVSRAAPDGQTILFTANPPFASAPLTQKQPAYDPLTSFIPVVRVGSVPLVLITANNSPLTSFAQMKDWVKANPAKANYAHSGIGSPGQLFTELIKASAGLPMLKEIPYKGTGQAMTDLIAGNVQVSMVSYPAAQPHLKAGTVRMLAVGAGKRMKDHPQVPTLAEALGQPDLEAGVWYGAFVPAGTPPATVARLHEDFAKANGAASVAAFMERSSIEPKLLNQAEFSAALRRDLEVARRMVDLAKASEK
jgi:tripartite-type tricarboxylate transporter receptor subunit TctC